MPVLGITGGIATGKSTFVQALLRHGPAALFDADRCARELLSSHESTKRAVRESFGSEAYDLEGRPNRSWLRELVFTDEGNRKKLEAILHPAIRTRWTEQARQFRDRRSWFYVDIPLLFETGAESYFDAIVVVACSPATQQRRLQGKRHLEPAMSRKIVDAQIALATKVAKAAHAIWNDSTIVCLELQAELLAGWLRSDDGDAVTSEKAR